MKKILIALVLCLVAVSCAENVGRAVEITQAGSYLRVDEWGNDLYGKDMSIYVPADTSGVIIRHAVSVWHVRIVLDGQSYYIVVTATSFLHPPPMEKK